MSFNTDSRQRIQDKETIDDLTNDESLEQGILPRFNLVDGRTRTLEIGEESLTLAKHTVHDRNQF